MAYPVLGFTFKMLLSDVVHFWPFIILYGALKLITSPKCTDKGLEGCMNTFTRTGITSFALLIPFKMT